VFPMIPILSGIIVGEGPGITSFKAFGLSLSYVLASALTYMVFGIIASLYGSNLQAYFQEPAVIAVFSAVFVVLALSMFGVFIVQMPSVIQSRLILLSSKLKGGNWLGAVTMGVLSTLAIGPCVTAPLAGALIFIGQTGDTIQGGLALFSLGLGMGIPLLVIGTTAGKLLPKAGAWMNITKGIFGIGLLAVAVWLLSRILSPTVTLLLWGLLFGIPLLYLGWKKFWKGLGLVALNYGVILLVGLVTHEQREYMQALCNTAVACEAPSSPAFQMVRSTEELQQKLAVVEKKGRPFLLYFYADWCVSCQEMKYSTFSDPKVQATLSRIVLLQADVTSNTVASQALLKQFNVIGPPAILFFEPDRMELKKHRVVGYIKPNSLVKIIQQVTAYPLS
ncbi:partial Thiol:disulfide interchange protein DsbD, partial [biofilm metagenome]